LLWRGPCHCSATWFWPADGSLHRLSTRLPKVEALLVDDWAMAPLVEPERRDFLEMCEDREQIRSTILTSQPPVAQLHARSATRRSPKAFWTG
jgi:DNA replication protein DnaC